MKYKVIVYYDDMKDSERVFHTKNEAINEMHRLGLKYDPTQVRKNKRDHKRLKKINPKK